MPPRAAVLAAVAVALLAGCAEQHAAAPPVPVPPPSASATLPAVNAPTPAPTASAAPTTGAVALTVHQGPPPPGVRRGPAWLVVSADPAAASVEIAWADFAAPRCGTAKDVWVEESATAVVLDLVRSAGRIGVVCPAVLVPRHATVPLSAPLGARVLEEHRTAPGRAGEPCRTSGPIAESVQIVCPLTPKR